MWRVRDGGRGVEGAKGRMWREGMEEGKYGGEQLWRREGMEVWRERQRGVEGGCRGRDRGKVGERLIPQDQGSH